MTQEQKDILLKDLCARVPYGVKFKHEGRRAIGKILSIYPHRKWTGVIYFDDAINNPKECDMDDIKPYLFPLSSITEEQFEEYMNIPSGHQSIDWFNKNHVDYRCLIERGLANDATGLNIY
jgi:hypothetical protein